ncbi:MAG TPA: hypothetical protein VJN62_02300 [Gemmatimonadales bacterium]|nr:hypothetical protein [Gemmatimonadales bacterium]
MNRDRVAAELAPAHQGWMRAHASAATWDATARDMAVKVGRRLLLSEGEAGWNPVLHGLLVDSESPAVRALAGELGCHPRRAPWSAHRVTKALQAYFGLHTAYRVVWNGLSKGDETAVARAA